MAIINKVILLVLIGIHTMSFVFAYVSCKDKIEQSSDFFDFSGFNEGFDSIQVQLLHEWVENIERQLAAKKIEIDSKHKKNIKFLCMLQLQDFIMHKELSRVRYSHPFHTTMLPKIIILAFGLPLGIFLWRGIFFCFNNNLSKYTYDSYNLIHTMVPAATKELSIIHRELKEGAARVELGMKDVHKNSYILVQTLNKYVQGSFLLVVFISLVMLFKHCI